MKYNFDEQITRRGSGCVKWDINTEEGILPMWVADMDFKAAPSIMEALQERLNHGVFGYTYVLDDYYRSVQRWFKQRHGWEFTREEMIYTIGVVPALNAIVRALTEPGDKVIIQSPAYNCFFSAVSSNDRELSANLLLERDHHFEIDFEDLERRAADPKATLLIFCNPHNPSGRVWSREELERVNDICLRNNVFVLADEIHCELTFKGHEYTPFATISEAAAWNSACCNSASKSFNIAGLQMANIVVRDPEKRKRIQKVIDDIEICNVNPFGVVAQMAAYDGGEEWLDELRDYIHENYLTVCRFFAERIPQIKVTRAEGTYLAWLDCKEENPDEVALCKQLYNEGKVQLNPGTMYGKPGGEGYLRLNMATPRATLCEGLERIAKVLEKR